MNWLIENIEWVFSGVGVALVSLVVKLILSKKKKQTEGSNNITIHSNNKGSGNRNTIISNSTIITHESDNLEIEEEISNADPRRDWLSKKEKYLNEPPYLLSREKGRSFVENDIPALIYKYSKANRVNKAIVFLDIDQQTIINKVHGDDVGDIVLTVIASILADNKRFNYRGRCGDDTFFGFNEYSESTRLRRNCEKILSKIRKFDWDSISPELRVTVSIGFSIYNPNDTPSEWLSKAAHAMLSGKKKGGNQVVAGPMFYGKIATKRKRESKAERQRRIKEEKYMTQKRTELEEKDIVNKKLNQTEQDKSKKSERIDYGQVYYGSGRFSFSDHGIS
ncbi:GGDEF domain-containing protein [uncultured Dokdonia sp.]|uniref:GGDEF domain-containing protein n=1 Tax=uncultured Dokdonia sp. TaxID=575653 RepID=UPI00261C3930|nr:GGDEF domain-containing protein [uncultured Dokdonia sp.]